MERASSPSYVMTDLNPFNAQTSVTSASSLQFHCFPPSPVRSNSNDFLRIRASKTSSQVEILKGPKQHETKLHFSSKKRRFAEEDAFPMSFPLHSKNPHAIYKDIQRLATQGKLKEALAILDYMDKQGIPVNVTTFSALIFACVKSKSLTEGRQVHVHIRINGLDDNEFLCTKLVHMYTSCGSIEDAKRVFENHPCKSVYTWNALLRGAVVLGHRQYRQVISTFSEMRGLGVELNVYSFSCLIKSFAGSSAFSQGLKAHALLLKNGLLNSSILQTSLIDMYFKCGKIRLACAMFDEIMERDIVAWGAMIAGFAHNRLQLEALEYARMMREEGIKPNSVILTTILPVIGEVRARTLGREIHAYVIKMKSYSKQLFIQSALIDMYCKCGDMVSGRKVFYGSQERNSVSWTALISGYISNQRLQQAMKGVVWMQQEGFKPDIVTVATVLPVCAELKALKQGKEIHGFAMKNGFLPNVSLITCLMVMYSKCGILEYSCKLFKNMKDRNVISWTAMIDSYIENGFLGEALNVFRSMQLSKHRPDSVAMARILSVCGKLSVLKLGKEIHGQVIRKKFEAIPFVSAEVIKMYGNCGAIGVAKLAFDGIPIKGSMTRTAILEAYGYNKCYQEAIDLFHHMRSGGFTPNHHTFNVLLSICEQAGLGDEACRTFELLTQRYRIKASEEHYSTIIRLLTNLHRFDEAERFAQMRSLS